MTVPRAIAAQVVRALGDAAPGPDTTDAAAWRARRGSLQSLFDPEQPSELTRAELSRVVEFLAEAVASNQSRHTVGEWRAEVDRVTGSLLSALR